MAKKRRKKKKELTIEEQLALMNPEEIYEKALKNITVAKVLEDIDLKVVSYNKAMYFLLYIVDKFDDQTLLYDQEVTKDGRTLSEEERQLLAVEEAQRLHDQIEIDMESECVKLIALYFKQACEDYEAAKTIDDVRIVRDCFVQIRGYMKKYVSHVDRLPEERKKEWKTCKKAGEYKKNCDARLEKLIAAGKMKRNIALVCAALIVIAAVAFIRTADLYYFKAKAESMIGLTERAVRDYQRSYEKQGDQESYERYLDYAYQAASESDDMEDAYRYYQKAAQGQYRDSEEKLAEVELALITDAACGDQVGFGTQTWIVVEKSEKECVLVSKKNAVDQFAYSTHGGTWDTSDARSYLNGEFLQEAFSAAEQELILSETVAADDNEEYRTKAGQATSDKVYLMSADELEAYQEHLGEAKPATWLRTPGADENSAAYAWKNMAMLYGYDSSADVYGLRPVIRVALNES